MSIAKYARRSTFVWSCIIFGIAVGIAGPLLGRVNLVEAGIVHPWLLEHRLLHITLVVLAYPGILASMCLLAMTGQHSVVHAFGIIIGQTIAYGCVAATLHCISRLLVRT